MPTIGRTPKASTPATELWEIAQERTTKLGMGTGKRIVALQRPNSNRTKINGGSTTGKKATSGMQLEIRGENYDEENTRKVSLNDWVTQLINQMRLWQKKCTGVARFS